MLQQTCPCGGPGNSSGGEVASDPPAYDACCGLLHHGRERAERAADLMRARYSAFALGVDDFLFTTWHPRTRPDDVRSDPGTVWTGLEILATEGGGPTDDTGVVEFVARWEGGQMHERSRFERRAGRWLYVDGDVA